jgi:hypothetical protein
MDNFDHEQNRIEVTHRCQEYINEIARLNAYIGKLENLYIETYSDAATTISCSCVMCLQSMRQEAKDYLKRLKNEV